MVLLCPILCCLSRNFDAGGACAADSAPSYSKKLRSPHDPGLDLFHRFAQGGITKVALGDLKEAGAWPAGLEKFEVCEGGVAEGALRALEELGAWPAGLEEREVFEGEMRSWRPPVRRMDAGSQRAVLPRCVARVRSIRKPVMKRFP